MPEKVVSLIDNDNVVQVLNEIEVPKKFFNRLSFGVQILDEMFGGEDLPGIMPGASFLVTGIPGAGKSTLCLQLADLMTSVAGRCVLYNIGEENKNVIKLRADRLKIAGDFCLSQYDEVDALIKFCRTTGVEVLFQDSLQSLHDGELTGKAALCSIVKKLHKFAHDNDVTVFIVGHSTKGGTFAGPQEIKHDVDVHAHLSLNFESGNWVMELEKNRFGPAAIQFEFSLSANGLDFQHVQQQVMAADQSKSAERREHVLKLIEEKLLAGEKISGYCFERFEVDCSGGFWRGCVSKATHDLQNKGFKISEQKIDGRTYVYIDV